MLACSCGPSDSNAGRLEHRRAMSVACCRKVLWAIVERVVVAKQDVQATPCAARAPERAPANARPDRAAPFHGQPLDVSDGRRRTGPAGFTEVVVPVIRNTK
jgi:hypothetical protein